MSKGFELESNQRLSICHMAYLFASLDHQYPESQKDTLDLTLPVPSSPRAGNPSTGGLEPPFVHINPQIPTRFARCQFSCQPGPNTKAASLLSKMWCQNQVTSRYLDDKTEHLFCAMIGLLQGLFHLASF